MFQTYSWKKWAYNIKGMRGNDKLSTIYTVTLSAAKLYIVDELHFPTSSLLNSPNYNLAKLYIVDKFHFPTSPLLNSPNYNLAKNISLFPVLMI